MSIHIKDFIPKNPFNLIWPVLGVSILGSAILNAVQSHLRYGSISRDLLVMGTVDAIVISGIVGYIVIDLVVTQRKEKEDELATLLITDELTQLHNRRGFYLLADQLVKMADREKTPVDIMYLDLDRLKWINDTYGHEEGDKVLVSVAAILKKMFRNSDIIARMGGDEFVVMPVGMSGSGTNVIRERVEKAFQKHNEKHGAAYTISVSMGFSRYDPASPCSLDELLKQADESMYKEKKIKQTARRQPVQMRIDRKDRSRGIHG
jgi:diguanylate cyclase (GGDEF)-like protein